MTAGVGVGNHGRTCENLSVWIQGGAKVVDLTELLAHLQEGGIQYERR